MSPNKSASGSEMDLRLELELKSEYGSRVETVMRLRASQVFKNLERDQLVAGSTPCI